MKLNSTVVFQKNYNLDKKIIINRGGTRSGKTYSILQLLFVWLISGKLDNKKEFKEGVCTIVRKHKSTIKGTVLRDWEEIISDSGAEFLFSKEHRNLTDKTYRYQGRLVEFIGADDQQKLRGGKRDILYCNEANELNYDQEFFQLLIRTTYKIFIDFNPDNEYVWINTELEQKRSFEDGDVGLIVSTYRDNPFLPEIQVKEIERLEKTNPRYWQVYGLGQYGKIEGIIFPDVIDIEQVPEGARFLGYGLDFGYTNDPSALIAVYQYNGGIIADEIFYEYGLTNPEIYAKIVAIGLDKKEKYIADSSEPKSIEELFRMGLNICGVKKGPDSIIYGLQVMMQQPVIYITGRSHNLRREFRSYVWDTDKDGKYINKPAQSPDHGIDSCRYLCMELLGKRRDKNNAGIIQAKR